MQQRRRVHWQMSQVPYQAVRHAVLRGAERVWRDLRFKDLHRIGKEFELMGRAMSFAALAMLTLFPLLVVVAAASAATHHGIAVWVVYGMGLTGSAHDALGAHAEAELGIDPDEMASPWHAARDRCWEHQESSEVPGAYCSVVLNWSQRPILSS